jgi:hypothetical protein
VEHPGAEHPDADRYELLVMGWLPTGSADPPEAAEPGAQGARLIEPSVGGEKPVVGDGGLPVRRKSFVDQCGADDGLPA